MRAWKPSLLLAGSANQELEGSLSSPALTGDVRSRDGHEPWTSPARLAEAAGAPEVKFRVPPSRRSESVSLSLSFVHGDPISVTFYSMYPNCPSGGCDRQDVTDGVSGVGGSPAVASG